MRIRLSRSPALCSALLVVGALGLPVQAVAANASLSLAQAASNEQVMRLPVCSDSLTTNCRKRGSNGIWIVLGLAAVAGIAAAAAAGGGSGSAPPPPPPPPPVSP
jgi:hypothetical protein